MRHVLRHKGRGWDWKYLCTGSGIRPEDVFEHPKIKWSSNSLSELSCNENIKFSDVINYPHVNWKWVDLSKNTFASPYYTLPIHKKHLCSVFMSACHRELIAKACSPDRICQWNEDFCEDYVDLYKLECLKWLDL